MRRALWDARRWDEERRSASLASYTKGQTETLLPYFGEELPRWVVWPRNHRLITFLTLSVVLCGVGALIAPPLVGIGSLVALALTYFIPWAVLFFYIDSNLSDRGRHVVAEAQCAEGPVLGQGDVRLFYRLRKDERHWIGVFAEAEHHVLIVGPAGSGKTTRSLVPGVMFHDGPVVSTSTRDDVMIPTGSRRGWPGTMWLYDPTGRIKPYTHEVKRVHWSPLRSCEDWDGARKMARQMVRASIRQDSDNRNAHWIERTQIVLPVLLHGACLAKADMPTVLRWARDFEDESAEGYTCPQDELVECLSKPGVDTGALHAFESFARTGTPRERADVLSTCSRVLQAYYSDAALESAKAPYFDPDAFVTSDDTLYLALNPDDQEVMAPLIVGLIHDIVQACYRYREDNGKPPPKRILLALDELANMAPLPDLERYLTDGRANGISILAAVQDLSQLEDRWGTSMRAQAFTRFRSWIIYPGIADKETLELISLLVGEQTIYDISRAQHTERSWLGLHRRYSKGTSEQVSRRPILEPADLSAIPEGFVLARRDQEWGYLRTAIGTEYIGATINGEIRRANVHF